MNIHFNLNKYVYIWKLFCENFFLSLYNQRFYQKIYIHFKGLGFKHFLVCCLLASVINSVWLFAHFENLANYLKAGTNLSQSSSFITIFDGKSWDKIFNDLPEIEYDNKVLQCSSIEKGQVFYISSYNDTKNKLVAIDLDNKLIKDNYPKITLTRREIIIRPKLDHDNLVGIPYQIIGASKFVIDGKKLKNILTNQVVDFEKKFLYKIFPIILLVNIYYEITQNILLILLSAICVHIVFKKDFKQGVRVVFFAISAIIVLKAFSRIFIQNVSFVDYCCIFTVFNAVRAVLLSQQNIKI